MASRLIRYAQGDSMTVRRTPLGGVVAAAACILALPARASASGHLYHSGATQHSGSVVGSPVLLFRGPLWLVSSPLGGVVCDDTHAEVVITTTGAHLADLELTTETCTGFGAFEGCELVDDEVTGLPATITPTANDLDLQGVEFDFELIEIPSGPGCAATGVTRVIWWDVTLHPDDKRRITSFALEGEAIAEVFGLELESEVGGELEVTGGSQGTYGIEVY